MYTTENTESKRRVMAVPVRKERMVPNSASLVVSSPQDAYRNNAMGGATDVESPHRQVLCQYDL